MPTLSASAYVVLGLLDREGATTPYGLDREIQQSIGHFWAFPRSQIYAEAARLVRRGLVVEERESTGRRRRTLSLTRAGRDALAEWLTGPGGQGTDIRDEGLLRLYFQRDTASGAAQVRRLAEQQRDAHRRKLAGYEDILAAASAPEEAAPEEAAPEEAAPEEAGDGIRFEPPQAAALAFGLRFEELAVAFWTEIAEHGVSTMDPRPGA
ncbi:PadR family transcriptional regulator [Streptomyces sp. XM4011]|uniref:PadR family transcriptional regulator n=1 Tax=Streptomyces sp. XM4011 TaxID=2929780 RepID=UPI001FF9D71A|nr:PadR family transcriptional regulator [Streptomyces sp. XM4011]MCK1813232.1 PadR family transcriptional regulator [Streptomyces sp. XM4011]